MMADYSTLIDAETWAFIKRTSESYPDDAVATSIADQRRVYDAMCKVFNAGRPDGIDVTDTNADHVPLRHYRKADQENGAMVLYFHGGGFVVGGLDSHDDICAEICKTTGLEVVAVDYRLSPENQHPAAFDDAILALIWSRENIGKPVVLVGDSAGGNLAAAVAHATRAASDILGQVLIYPGLGGNRDQGSYLTHANAPMLTRDEILFYENIRTDGSHPKGDATYAPLWDASFAGLPPTVTMSAQCDPLCDDGQEYCGRINAAGGTAISIEDKGLVHGHLRGRHSVKRIQDSFARVNRAISILGANQELTLKAIAG